MTATIFVSSTPFDLALHRKKIADALKRQDAQRPALTLLSALPETGLEERLRLIRSAQVYIGIFGMVYGNTDPVSGRALMQLEYEEAQAYCIPSLIYLIDEDEHLVLPKHVDTGASAQQLSDFKSRLSTNPHVRFFNSADDLLAKIQNDLLRLLAPPAASGVTASAAPAEPQSEAAHQSPEAANIAEVVSARQTNEKRYRLTAPRFEFFKDKVTPALTHAVSAPVLQDALEYLLANNTMSASSSLARGTGMPLDEAIEEIRNMELIIIDLVQKHQPHPAEPK